MTNVLLIIVSALTVVVIVLLSYIIYFSKNINIDISSIVSVLFDKIEANTDATDHAYRQGYEDGKNERFNKIIDNIKFL